MTFILSSAVFALLAATVTSVPAPGLAVSEISVNHGIIMQQSKAGEDTQAVFMIHNDGVTADTLTGWSCTLAETTVLAGSDGKPMQSLLIPPGKTVALAANGAHLILKNIRFTVDYGSTVPCAMTFENEGSIRVLLYADDTKKP